MRTLLFLLLSTLGAALAGCNRTPPVTYRTEPVTRGPLAEVVSATGEVSALVTVSVGSQVSGTVSKLYVDFNAPVKAGQVLADLDPRLFEAALARAEAGLAAAQAEVERAKVTLGDARRQEERILALAERQLASRAEVETAEATRSGAAAALRAAEARVYQARAERDTARTNLALARIRSPIDGVVISRAVDVGQTVAAAFQAPTLFTIANDLTRMQVLAHVDEADVGKVKAGMTARFTVDAYPGDTFEGTIREVRQAPTTIQNVVTYAAVIDAPNPERKLRQGMTAQVTVVTAQREDVLRVPNAALRYRPAGERDSGRGGRAGGDGGGRPAGGEAPRGGGSASAGGGVVPQARADGPAERPGRGARVFRLENGAPVAQPVQTGITDGRLTEVVSGLSEGDAVVIGDSSPNPSGPGPGGPRRGLF
jgi:HlyD family secretion protein